MTIKWHADSRVMSGADVDPRARLGPAASVWHLAQIREDAEIGADCSIGRGAYIGPEVRLGQRCKVQNYALIYEPAWLDDGVFVGPGVVFTNDRSLAATADRQFRCPRTGAGYVQAGETLQEQTS